jgi:hypothetical protein
MRLPGPSSSTSIESVFLLPEPRRLRDKAHIGVDKSHFNVLAHEGSS